MKSLTWYDSFILEAPKDQNDTCQLLEYILNWLHDFSIPTIASENISKLITTSFESSVINVHQIPISSISSLKLYTGYVLLNVHVGIVSHVVESVSVTHVIHVLFSSILPIRTALEVDHLI